MVGALRHSRAVVEMLATARARTYTTGMPPPCPRGALSVFLAAAGSLVACSAQPDKPPPVFGGQGAQVAMVSEKPLPAGAGTPVPAGPCGKNGPASDAPIIDDFEDSDGRIFKAFERDGFWFTAGDNSPGSTISPSGSFAPELLPPAESTKENRFAAHFKAAGQTQWGAVFGTALSWTQKGIKCPLNLSSFVGVRFRAKGPGSVRLSVAVPEVVPKDGGGTCTEGCYDGHGKLFLLGNAWDTYEARWDKLAQAGWGTDARFTPERIVNLTFNAPVPSLPIDFWVDDVELIPQSAPAKAAAQ